MIIDNTSHIIKQNNQIFKKQVPINLILNLFKDNFEENNSIIKINAIMFNKMKYNNKLELFKQSFRGYYHTSKLKYIDKVINYKDFLTVIRQICKSKNINYNSNIVYNNSCYEIQYLIYIK